jgi:hypothetical protein
VSSLPSGSIVSFLTHLPEQHLFLNKTLIFRKCTGDSRTRARTTMCKHQQQKRAWRGVSFHRNAQRAIIMCMHSIIEYYQDIFNSPPQPHRTSDHEKIPLHHGECISAYQTFRTAMAVLTYHIRGDHLKRLLDCLFLYTSVLGHNIYVIRFSKVFQQKSSKYTHSRKFCLH